MILPLFAVLALAAPQDQHVRPPVRVDAGNPVSAAQPAAAFDERRAAVAWVDAAFGGDHVFLARSGDGGVSFGPREPVDLDPSGAAKRLGEDGVHWLGAGLVVLWQDARAGADDLRARRWAPTGWGTELRLDDGHAPGVAAVRELRVAADPATGFVGALFVVSSPAGDELRFVSSLDGGLTFGASSLLASGAAIGRIALARDGGALHAAWQDDSAGAFFRDLRYRRSADLGASWLPRVELSTGMVTDPSDLSVAADGARVAVGFQEVSALCSVGVFQSADGGASWAPGHTRVAGSLSPASVAQNPRLLFVPGHLVVAWADDRLTAGLRTPWIAWTADGGASWTERALFPTPGHEPQLVGDSARGGFAVLWNGSAQLYAAVSRAPVPDPGPAFTVDTGSGLAAARMARDARYADHLAVWLERDPTTNQDHLWAAGFRAANVVPQGVFAAGGTASFRVAGFPHDETGWWFQVALALAPGSAPLPWGDRRALGLAADPLLLATAGHPALRGVLAGDGSGATPPTAFPPTVPPGTRLHFAAVAVAPAARRFGAISDVRAVTVQ